MHIVIRALALLSVAGYTALAQEGCFGKKNMNPVLDLRPQLQKTVKNGQRWLMKEGENFVYIAKVRGTPFEMGKAYGELFKDELKQQI